MVFHKSLVSAKLMSFHSFSQNPTLFCNLFAENLKILKHGSLHEKLLVSAKLVSFHSFSQNPTLLSLFAENLMTTLFYVGPSVPKKFRDDFFDPNGTICAQDI